MPYSLITADHLPIIGLLKQIYSCHVQCHILKFGSCIGPEDNGSAKHECPKAQGMSRALSEHIHSTLLSITGKLAGGYHTVVDGLLLLILVLSQKTPCSRAYSIDMQLSAVMQGKFKQPKEHNMFFMNIICFLLYL